MYNSGILLIFAQKNKNSGILIIRSVYVYA